MPTYQYALAPKEPKRLTVAAGRFWRNTTISLDGQALTTFADQKELNAGRDLVLPDGSRLHVQLQKGLRSSELRLLHNGEPVPGSSSDPATKLSAATGTIFFVAGLNLVLGLIAIVTQAAWLSSIGMGAGSIIFGLIFLVLGFFVRQHSLIALILAIVLFVIDGLLGLALTATAGGQPVIGGLIVRFFLVLSMVQAIPALQTLKSQAKLMRS